MCLSEGCLPYNYCYSAQKEVILAISLKNSRKKSGTLISIDGMLISREGTLISNDGPEIFSSDFL